jgi:hypothetical protein
MTKYLIAFLILLSIATFSLAEDKPLCEEYKCYAAWGFGFNDMFGFGGSSGTSGPTGPTGDGIQLETGDFLLTEDSKYLIQE